VKQKSVPSTPNYLNYDYDGTLYVSLSSDLVKFSANTMPSSETSAGAGSGSDIAIGESHVLAYNGINVELRTKDLATQKSTVSFSTALSEPGIAFISSTEAVAFGQDGSSNNVMKKMTVDESTPAVSEATTRTVSAIPKKVIPAPDGTFYVGFGNGSITRYNADLTEEGTSFTSYGTACAGLVVDVE
jgi:hypothetical protein